ncbi:glycosyltransferase family 4 protein [Piscinibacter gummiphilus]|uniref:glycosyltransferase family 4 protein n=1 Tax=Piscinibacter gummiphilus TaxID=946333 RepID=UPI000A26C744|nr:glycosyltransferase family 1 protein [Piscinibacter gummiphilus]ATU67337.1 glycosyltransferase family 1 protein [Piscinibacter gummiphilus]GLS97682.1 mannosyltransferase [Piscinibacter gummiphilus]
MNPVVYDYQTFSLQQYGGISRYFCELALRVHRTDGFRVKVVAPVHFNEYLPECGVPQVAAYLPMRIPRTGRLYRGANRLLGPLLTRAASPSLIHRTYYTPMGSPSGVPVVVTVFDMIHELFADRFPAGDTTSRDKRASLERADHILCISESTANDLVRLFDIPREKMSVTHLGYSNIFATPRTAQETAPHARPYLLYVGHRVGYKNFDMALKAYASSARLRGEFDFVTFGGPPLSASERSLIEELGLAPSQVVRIGGSDADLARAYRHARAFVYPSQYEGFGIPPLEAMSSGCPVACSDVSSVPEVVGQAAALFDPMDVESIRAALESLCLNDVRRQSMIDAGNERVRQFSWDRCAADTVAAYRKVLGT